METDRSSLRSEELGKDNKHKRNNFLIPSFLCDVAILASLGAFAYYLRFTTTFQGFSRYFLCGDYALQYPYYGGDQRDEKKSAEVVAHYDLLFIQDLIFYPVMVGLPPFVVLLGEFMYMCLTPPAHKIITSCCDACCIPLVLRRLCRNVGVYLAGMCILSILVDVIKMMSGTQRPYFLNVPGINASTINTAASPYCIVDVSLSEEIRDASQSFPSYHSAMGAYAAVFCACYVHAMFTLHGSHLFRPILNGAFISLALLAGFSQWMLYRNSWTDLIVGYVFGAVGGLYASFGLLHGMREHEPDKVMDFEDMDEEQRQRMIEEARPAIFRWMTIPRLTMKFKASPTYPTLATDAFEDPALQQEQLARSIQRGDPGPSNSPDVYY